MATIAAVAAARGGQQRALPLPDDPTPQQLCEWVVQRGRPGGGGYRCVKAVALGASESAATPGASEFAAAPGASESTAALGARESADALGASASTATVPASAEVLHTFTLDSGASRCFYRDCTIVTPLPAPVPVSLADPSGGPVVARASTVLPCLAVPSGSLSGLHLPTFSTNLVSNAAIQDRWHHRLGHPSLPRLRSMHSRLLVSGLPRTLPPLPRSIAPPCLPCVEGRQHAGPHSFEFPPTTAPLQTIHMDVWGLAPVGGTDQERYFLLVVDDYTCYTTVFPLRRNADVSSVLIPWIRATRLQLHERFQQDFPVLRLHSDRGGEFSYGVLETFLSGRGHRPPGDASSFRVWGALSLVRDTKASKLSPCTLRCVFLGFPTDALPWQFDRPASRRVLSSQDVTFDESVCYYRLHPYASHPVPLAPLFLVPVPPPVDPLPPQGLAPSGVSQVDPPPLDEPVEISSDSFDLAEGGDTAADDTATTRRTPRLETHPRVSRLGRLRHLCSLLLWTLEVRLLKLGLGVVLDTGAETEGARAEGTEPAAAGSESTELSGAGTEGTEPAGAGTEGTETLGADSGGAETSGANSGGAGSPSRGPGAGGTGAGQPPQPALLETLSPQAIRSWVVRRGSPGGGGCWCNPTVCIRLVVRVRACMCAWNGSRA
ncbi:unnamed protein product [Closterium sp. NIES-53]